MAGTSSGARKRLETIRSQPGGNERLRKWAQLGGKYSSSRTFRDPELASRAGKAGAATRRKNKEAKKAE